jgi:hypothetical protein
VIHGEAKEAVGSMFSRLHVFILTTSCYLQQLPELQHDLAGAATLVVVAAQQPAAPQQSQLQWQSAQLQAPVTQQ